MYLENDTLIKESSKGQLTLPKTLSNSYVNSNIIFNGSLYEIHYNRERNLIYCNASLSKSELIIKIKSKIRLNKIIPPSFSVQKLKKQREISLWKFDTVDAEWPIEDNSKSYFLVVYNGKLASNTKASEDNSYSTGYRQLLKEKASRKGIILEDDLLNNVFDSLDKRVLDFFNCEK
jgi:hypothetical protein